jgi:hypothetical protein
MKGTPLQEWSTLLCPISPDYPIEMVVVDVKGGTSKIALLITPVDTTNQKTGTCSYTTDYN